jgi:hypothetical protein
VTVTEQRGVPIGHGCARPHRSRQALRTPGGPDPPGGADGPWLTFTRADDRGPPGGFGTWRLATGTPGRRELIVALGPVAIDDCDHRHEAQGHDPGVMLRHLAQVRHARCTGPGCRRPASRCDFDHNVPFGQGGRTCLCNGGPPCKR